MSINRTRKKTSEVWKLFRCVSRVDKVARCILCNKTFSYKSTITNLKQHLSKAHGDGTTNSFRIILEETGDDNAERAFSDLDDESEDESKVSEVRPFFERETGGRARCLMCSDSVPNHHADLRRHLDQHPKLLHEQQDSDVQLQNEDDDDQETYTEVVYLEEANPKEVKKTEKKKWQNETPVKKWRAEEIVPKSFSKKKQKYRHASSSSDEPLIKRNKGDDEIRKFGEYIICLLQKLPGDVCMKMQMNIVNMIMNANLANTSAETVPVVQPVPATVPIVTTPPGTVPVTIQPIPPGYYVLGKNTSEKTLLQNNSVKTVPVTSSLDGNHSYSITIAPSPAAVTTVTNNDTESDKQNKFTENGA